MEKKPRLISRVLGGLIYYVLDNLFVISALVAAIFGSNVLVVVAFLVAAFYERLTQIRDAVRASDVSISIGGQQLEIKEVQS